jgi:hypothetical protein
MWFGYLDQKQADVFVGVRQKGNPVVFGKACCLAGGLRLALSEPDIGGKLGRNLKGIHGTSSANTFTRDLALLGAKDSK